MMMIRMKFGFTLTTWCCLILCACVDEGMKLRLPCPCAIPSFFVKFFFFWIACESASQSLRAVDLEACSALWRLYYTLKVLFNARVTLSLTNEHFHRAEVLKENFHHLKYTSGSSFSAVTPPSLWMDVTKLTRKRNRLVEVLRLRRIFLYKSVVCFLFCIQSGSVFSDASWMGSWNLFVHPLDIFSTWGKKKLLIQVFWLHYLKFLFEFRCLVGWLIDILPGKSCFLLWCSSMFSYLSVKHRVHTGYFFLTWKK